MSVWAPPDRVCRLARVSSRLTGKVVIRYETYPFPCLPNKNSLIKKVSFILTRSFLENLVNLLCFLLESTTYKHAYKELSLYKVAQYLSSQSFDSVVERFIDMACLLLLLPVTPIDLLPTAYWLFISFL